MKQVELEIVLIFVLFDPVALGQAEAEEAGGAGQMRLRRGAHGGTSQWRILPHGKCKDDIYKHLENTGSTEPMFSVKT